MGGKRDHWVKFSTAGRADHLAPSSAMVKETVEPYLYSLSLSLSLGLHGMFEFVAVPTM